MLRNFARACETVVTTRVPQGRHGLFSRSVVGWVVEQAAKIGGSSRSALQHRGAHFEIFAHRRQKQRREGDAEDEDHFAPHAGSEKYRLKQLLTEVKSSARKRDWHGALATLRDVPDQPAGPEWAPLFYAVLACCCKELRYFEALSVWDEMPERDEIAYNMMINLSSRTRHLDEARRLFDEMPSKGLVASGVTYCALLNGLAAQPDHAEALAVLQAMKQEPRLDATTDWDQVYLLVISAFGRAGLYAKARLLFEEVRSERGVRPRHHHFNALIVACTKAADGATAQGLFHEMQEEGLVPREIDWNVLIQCFRTDFAESRRLFEAMTGNKVTPSEETFAALLQSASGSPQQQDVQWVLSEMTAFGIDAGRPASPRLRFQLQRMQQQQGRQRTRY
mmetsp:Transcript_7110/g.26036  ORF Transcript_7110/g.26036 Transcript_7110/m.26036 type:complete len:393 (-) Transcript_7110:444-1622(-)